MLQKIRVLKSVEMLPIVKGAHVCWSDQITEDGALVAETLDRKAYTYLDKEAFIAEVPGALLYAEAIGWEDPVIPEPQPDEPTE